MVYPESASLERFLEVNQNMEEVAILNPLASLSRKRSISSSSSVVHFQFVWQKSALFLAIKYKIKTSMNKVLPSSSRGVNVVDLSHMTYS
jgi:hypothetical protein